jgi:hypothetical protein
MKNRVLMGIEFILLIFVFLFTSVHLIEAFDLLGKFYRFERLNPGDTCQGVINISNPSDSTEHIRAYVTDYYFSADGTTSYKSSPASKRSNAQWIKLSPEVIHLEAGQEGQIRYSIRIPDTFREVGSFWSMIHLEPIAEGSLIPKDKSKKEDISFQIRTLAGYGVQIITNVGNGGNCAVQLFNPRLEQKTEGYIFTVDCKSVGSLLANVIPWVDIFDDSGNKIVTVAGNKRTIYPECSASLFFNLGQLEKGGYRALVIADCGNDQVFGGQYELEIR